MSLMIHVLTKHTKTISLEITNLILNFMQILLPSTFIFLKQMSLYSRIHFQSNLGKPLPWRRPLNGKFSADSSSMREVRHFGSLLRVRARVLGKVPYGSSLTCLGL